MIIPKKILKEWSELRERGDVKALKEYTGGSHALVGRALNYGKCTEDLFKKISSFYRDRKSLLQWK